MGLGDRINQIRKDKKISIDDLCALSGIPKGTLSKITAGITTNPTLETVRAIAAALNCTLDDFDDLPASPKNVSLYSSEENAMIKKYRALDGHGKEMVGIVLEKEIIRIEKATAQSPPEIERVHFSIPEYDDPMSAGTGQPAGYGYGRNLLLTKEPPRGTSYVAPIAGDSMEPTYHDGDKLFIQACYSIEVGEIGVFFMDGQQWVKELGEGMLLSHNPKYEPRPMTEDIRCQGRVLGICDESYFC